MPACYRHPARETNVGCSNCSRPICPDCMTSTPVGMRCPECARQRTKVHHAPAGLTAGGPAPVTMALMALNLIGFVAELAGGAGLFRGGGTVYNDGALVSVLVGDGEVYRLVTSAFLHSGLVHFGINMLALYFLGNLLERAIGPWRFAAIYFVSLLGGSLGVILLGDNGVGASGAVFGLLGAGYLIARDRGLDDVASQIGFFVVLNLVLTFSIPGISIGAHLGGLVTGGLCALLLRESARRSATQRRALEIGGFVVLGAIALVGAIALAPAPPVAFG